VHEDLIITAVAEIVKADDSLTGVDISMSSHHYRSVYPLCIAGGLIPCAFVNTSINTLPFLSFLHFYRSHGAPQILLDGKTGVLDWLIQG
jgi:hypothetical protein